MHTPTTPGRRRRARRGAGAGLLALLLAACHSAVEVRTPFPPPLVERLPLNVAVSYPPALADFVYHEEDASQQEWTVRLGNANQRMFDAVFDALFTSAVKVSSIEAARAEMPALDAIITPSIDAFEMSSPLQSAGKQYAVWIRYNLDVLGPDGQLIVRWPIAAYGQAGTGGMSGVESLERATALALRDAAATIALGFGRQPKIREVLLRERGTDEH